MVVQGTPRHTGRIRKTTLVIDDELMEEARTILGTEGIKATIDRALREVVIMDARRKLIDRLRTMEGMDLDKPEVMERAWR